MLAHLGSRYNCSHFGSEALLYVLIGEGAGMALMSHSGAVRNLPLTISTCENSCDFARRFVIENSERQEFALSFISYTKRITKKCRNEVAFSHFNPAPIISIAM